MYSRCNHLDPGDGLHLGGEASVSGVWCMLLREYTDAGGPVDKVCMFFDASGDIEVVIGLMGT